MKSRYTVKKIVNVDGLVGRETTIPTKQTTIRIQTQEDADVLYGQDLDHLVLTVGVREYILTLEDAQCFVDAIEDAVARIRAAKKN